MVSRSILSQFEDYSGVNQSETTELEFDSDDELEYEDDDGNIEHNDIPVSYHNALVLNEVSLNFFRTWKNF